MLPEGWKHATIENLGAKGKPAVKAGPFGSSLKKEYYKPFGYKIYGQEQVISNDENYGNYFIDENKYNELKSCSVSPGDILISLVGTIGQTLLLSNSCQQGIINPRLLRISLNKDLIIPAYIQYILASNYTQNILKRWAQGGTMGVLNAEMIKTFPILLPPLPEQKKIAAILSTWDRAIEGTEKLLANSQQQKKALMQQLLTGKKRLPGFTGEWKIGTISEIAHIDTGFAFKSSEFTDDADGMPVVRMSDLKDGILNLESCKRLNLNSLSGLTKFSLKENDFIFGMSGSLSNFAWVKNNNLPCYLNQRVGRIRSKTIGDQKFISYLYLSEEIQKEIEDKAAGAAQLNISLNDIRGMKIKIPPLPEQKAIAAVLTTADKEITAIESDLSRLRQEKKALMQQLLTGKRRVKVD